MSLTTSKQSLMQLFLDENYITLSALAEECMVSETEIQSLENAQCIPGHTYESRQICIFTCAGIDTALTENASINTTIYFHNSVAHWVTSALVLLKSMNLSTLALHIKDRFIAQLDTLLGKVRTPGCQSFDQAWAYWIDGTWGKCLKNISADCLVQKELSRKCIAEIMEYSPLAISSDKKNELTNAVNNYITSSLDFDTYGMRHILAEEAIEKFQLDVEINKKYFSRD